MTRDARLRLDPELAAIGVLIPEFDLSDVPAARRLEQSLLSQGRNPLPGVESVDCAVPRRSGGDIPIRIYRRSERSASPALLYIHGGAFILGGLSTEDDRCEYYARDADCTVIALDYRLAPEHPFPAAFEDCLDVLEWMHAAAQELRIDPRRIAIGGNSAGGALAAAVALEARDLPLAPLVHQLLVNPVLDHRSVTESVQRFTVTPGWTRAHNLLMWDWYLRGSKRIDQRASPALADDLTGSPSTSMWIAEFDPLRDEDYQYATKLMASNVSLTVHQYAGTFHGFDGYRMTSVGQRALADQVFALRRAFRD